MQTFAKVKILLICYEKQPNILNTISNMNCKGTIVLQGFAPPIRKQLKLELKERACLVECLLFLFYHVVGFSKLSHGS